MSDYRQRPKLKLRDTAKPRDRGDHTEVLTPKLGAVATSAPPPLRDPREETTRKVVLEQPKVAPEQAQRPKRANLGEPTLAPSTKRSSSSAASSGRARLVNGSRNALFFPLLFLAGMIGGASLMSLSGIGDGKRAPGNVASPRSTNIRDTPELQERVNFHRDLTGRKLNRERMSVEYENSRTAPGLHPEAGKVPMDDMMKGLPLQGETHHRKSSRDRLVPVNPSYPDAEVAASVSRARQELHQQYAEEREARQMLTDFVKKAGEEGYAVSIDENGIATVVDTQERQPAARSKARGGRSDSGAVR